MTIIWKVFWPLEAENDLKRGCVEDRVTHSAFKMNHATALLKKIIHNLAKPFGELS